MTATVIPFLPRLCIMALPTDALSSEQVAPALVDHGGQVYRLANLVARLFPARVVLVEATAPRTGQVAWDEVMRWWPRMAEEIVTGCRRAK